MPQLDLLTRLATQLQDDGAAIPAWFPLDDQGRSVDEWIAAIINDLAPAPSAYDPLHVEIMLSKAADLLDRCLIYRREIYDLEIAAGERMLSYRLFNQLLSTNIGIEQRSALRTNADPAERDELIQMKWDVLATAERERQSMHDAPASSWNYRDRRERLLNFLKQDIAEAYGRLQAAAVGLARIFGVTTPPLAAIHSLDDLVLWARAAVRTLDLTIANDTEFHREFWLMRNGFYTSKSAFAANFNTTPYDFRIDLAGVFPTGIERVRVKGVGLSYGSKLISRGGSDTSLLMTQAELTGITALIFPPDGASPRAPIALTHCGIARPGNQGNMARPDTLQNIDPRGIWTIRLSPKINYPEAQDLHFFKVSEHVEELVLHLSLEAGLPTAPASWTDFGW